jgi:hypothetical protein
MLKEFESAFKQLQFVILSSVFHQVILCIGPKKDNNNQLNSRNVLVNALPLNNEGATASRQRTICAAIDRIGLQADKVHDTYQRLIKFDPNENHHDNFYERQQLTGNEHNNIIAHMDKVLDREEGPLQQRQQPVQGGVQGNIVAATVAAMQAANSGNLIKPKKIDYHLKPKILGKEFTTSELRT